MPATSAAHRHATVTTRDGLFPAGDKDVFFFCSKGVMVILPFSLYSAMTLVKHKNCGIFLIHTEPVRLILTNLV
jgi:hypothetical protein